MTAGLGLPHKTGVYVEVEKIFDEQHHTLLRRGIIFQVNENKDFSICRILIAFLCLLRHKQRFIYLHRHG